MHVDDRTRLQHMLDAARDAITFIRGKTVADLARDKQLTLALLKCIEIMGEAASRISPAMREGHPEVRWVDIIGMRNRLVHVYYDVDAELVFETVRDELPPLIETLERFAKE
jgi:uncharacterized protein with HEPN domain